MSDTGTNFIEQIIEDDLASGKHSQVVTRFPPEPNGYLHIGHAKAICIDFGMAQKYGGWCNLRMDDTNPEKESEEYVRAIEQDIRWLGFEWKNLLYASDYFDQLYAWAEHLIVNGHAYVCDLSEEAMRAGRGTVNEAGTPSPFRDRSPEDNLRRFRSMRDGEFEDGACVLRARIDMAHPNMKLRDPPIYRIRHQHHHNTGDTWCIYPLYDYTHCLSDAIEGITHSLCSLEFQDNRALYDWFVERCPVPAVPKQYEFARMSLGYTITSKRKLLKLVETGVVDGWDDPRMPTLSGLRRRGVPPEALRDFVARVGVAKAANIVDPALLDHCVRDALNHQAPRVMAVLDPLELVIDSWEGGTEWLDGALWPHDVPREGSRKLPFSGRLYVERSDFAEQPPKGWRRLAPGVEVRLRYGYFVTVTAVEKDGEGRVVRLHATHDPASRGGTTPDRRKVKGTLHWVSAGESVEREVRLYDRLFQAAQPGKDRDWEEDLNPDALTVVTARVEPYLADAASGQRFQFERTGYFVVDPSGAFNRTVPLKDTWGKSPDASAQPTKAVTVGEVGERSFTDEQQTAIARHEAAGLARSEAELLATDAILGAYYGRVVAAGASAKGAANWLVHELQRARKDRTLAELPFGPRELAALIGLVEDGTISSKLGKKVLAELLAEGGSPRAIVEARGWVQISDPAAIAPLVAQALAANPDHVARYKGGNERLAGFFVGQVLKASGGKANPGLVNQLVLQALAEA